MRRVNDRSGSYKLYLYSLMAVSTKYLTLNEIKPDS